MSVIEVTTAQVQPRLAPFAAGVIADQEFIAEQVLPPVDVGAQQFTYETYDNVGLVDQGSMLRGLNSGSTILQPGKNSTVTAFLKEASAKVPLDVTILAAAQAADEKNPMPGMSRAEWQRIGRMQTIARNNQIQKEKDVATLVFTNTNFETALRTTALSFKTCTISDIKDAMRAVQKLFGRLPDTFVLGHLARTSFDVNDKFLDRINGGATATAPAVVSNELLASLIGVRRVIVGGAVTQPLADAGTTPASSAAIWTEDAAALIYTGSFETANVVNPGFGKVFYMNVPETGSRYATWSWMDDEPNTVEWQKAAEYYLVPSSPIMKAGYHFTNADQ